MWKNISLAKKIVSGLFFMIFIGILGLCYNFVELKNIDVLASRVILGTSYTATLLNAETAHINWVNNIANYILKEEAKPIPVITDGTKCAFGTWYYGKDRKGLEERIPDAIKELARIEDFHLKLHESAIEIGKAVQAGNTEEAIKIFNAISMNNLNEVKKSLDATRDVVNKRVEDLNSDLTSKVDDSQTASIITIIMLIIIGIAASIALVKSITSPVKHLVIYASNVAKGKLEQPDIHQNDEVGQLATAMGQMVTSLQEKILDAEEKTTSATQKEAEAKQANIESLKSKQDMERKHIVLIKATDKLADVINAVSSSLNELSSQIHASENGARDAAMQLNEVTEAVGEMNNTIVEIAESSSTAAEVSTQARNKADEGEKIVYDSLNSIKVVQKDAISLKDDMKELSTHTQSISRIMSVISDIADQTNLLALNAAIEAARAGDAGRGFAVVADEVRKLAEKTMVSTSEVGKAIQSIQQSAEKSILHVDSTVKLVEATAEQSSRSGEALHDIVTMVDKTSAQIQGIATASQQQAATSTQIHRSINAVNDIAKHSVTAMIESNIAVTDINKQIDIIVALVDDMKAD